MVRSLSTVAGSLSGAAALFVDSASAQVIIPHGDYDSDIEKYVVAGVTVALLCLSAWRFWKARR